MPFNANPERQDYVTFLEHLLDTFPKGIAVVVPNKNIGLEVEHFAATTDSIVHCELAHNMQPDTHSRDNHVSAPSSIKKQNGPTQTHLQQLESQSIHILREVVAVAERPVMLYSAGKDSAVMLHLLRKATFPAKACMPLLHIDTTWKFQELKSFRDQVAQEHGYELLSHTNTDGVKKGVNPFTHGSALHIDIMKTAALKQALDKHGFDTAIAGTRRDEELARAKERVFSSRTNKHSWEPTQQYPELWNLYNSQKKTDECMRVFPLSNWSELDIWQYIHLQNIAIAPLYFSAERPVVERDGNLIMVDDERMPLNDGEVPMMRQVRFRTLDCYPLSSAVESNARTVPQIIQETLQSKTSEQQGRMTDHDSASVLEKRKQEGYF